MRCSTDWEYGVVLAVIWRTAVLLGDRDAAIGVGRSQPCQPGGDADQRRLYRGSASHSRSPCDPYSRRSCCQQDRQQPRRSSRAAQFPRLPIRRLLCRFQRRLSRPKWHPLRCRMFRSPHAFSSSCRVSLVRLSFGVVGPLCDPQHLRVNPVPLASRFVHRDELEFATVGGAGDGGWHVSIIHPVRPIRGPYQQDYLTPIIFISQCKRVTSSSEQYRRTGLTKGSGDRALALGTCRTEICHLTSPNPRMTDGRQVDRARHRDWSSIDRR